MPDAVVVRVAKDEWDAQAEKIAKAECARPTCSEPPPTSLLAKLRHLLFLPVRIVRSFLSRLIARLRKRLFGPRAKP